MNNFVILPVTITNDYTLMTRQVRKQSAMGSSRELAPSEIQFADSTDYLLGGVLTLENGRIDKYQFDEGYCQAERYANNAAQDQFTFYYYNRDHLGNVRQVTGVYVSVFPYK